MTLLWIGNILLVLVVLPVVVVILHSVLAPAREIKIYADDIDAKGGLFGPHLTALEELATTRDLVKQAGVEIDSYVRALDRVR